MIRRILSLSLGWFPGLMIGGGPVWAQEAAEGAGAQAGSEAGGLTLGSALFVLGTLVIVLGGVLVYLAIERRRA